MYTMKKIAVISKTPLDISKRKTLIALSGISVGCILASTSLPSGAAHTLHAKRPIRTNTMHLKADLDVALVSIPGVQREALKIVNLTEREILIERFRPSNLVFDGEIVDCNDACLASPIKIPANDDVLLQFDHSAISELESSAGEYLDASPFVSRLPAGTRIIRLSAIMQGSVAVLTLPEAHPAA
jgi:hypothetical protein